MDIDRLQATMRKVLLAFSPDDERDLESEKPKLDMVDLRNETFFPPYFSLPDEYNPRPAWYCIGPQGLRPRKHWCFLAEIVEHVFWPIRPMYTVRDIGRQEWHVAFHLDDRSQFPAIEQTFKVGYTIAVMYAEGHLFMDGKVGLRIEDMAGVRILPCGLESLLETSDSFHKPSKVCPLCDKPASLRCSLCKLLYCGKECQALDWKHTHKKECIVRRQIIEWSRFNWARFDSYRGFEGAVPPIPKAARDE